MANLNRPSDIVAVMQRESRSLSQCSMPVRTLQGRPDRVGAGVGGVVHRYFINHTHFGFTTFLLKVTRSALQVSQPAHPEQCINTEMSDSVAHLRHPQLGILKGRRTNGAVQFLGLKYGVLKHRFAVPEINLASQEQDIDATRYGYVWYTISAVVC